MSQKSHNEGQEDGAKGEYKNDYTPGIGAEFFSSDDELAARREEAEDYDKGFENGYEQTHGSGCFLTTACVEAAGLPDSCEELVTLRWFRDVHLLKSSDGCRLVSEYYRVAPQILSAINGRDDRDKILADILANTRQTVRLIQSNNHAEAIEQYRMMVTQLERDCLHSPQSRGEV
jgi:hypothetical protein